jgi:hypothetical protein
MSEKVSAVVCHIKALHTSGLEELVAEVVVV